MAEQRRGRGRGAWADYLGGAPAHPDPISSGHLAVAGDRLIFAAPGGEQLAIPLVDLRGLSVAAQRGEGRAIRSMMRIAAERGGSTAVLEFGLERRQAAALRLLIERALERRDLGPLPRVEQLEPAEQPQPLVEPQPELEPQPDDQAPELPPWVEPRTPEPHAEPAPEPEPSAGSRHLAFAGPLFVATVPTLALVALAALLVMHSGSGGQSTAKGSSGTGEQSAKTAAGAEPVHAGWKPHPGPVPILMYHPIQDPLPNTPYPELFVRTKDFRAQMGWLERHGYEGVTLDQVEDAWTRHKTLPPKPVVVSFDDGYQSQSVNAAPILDKLGWPGVLDLRAEGADLPDSKVKALIDDGWELASHTINHVDVSTLSGPELTREVAGSRDELQKRFDVPVDNFCYPSGKYDAAAIAAVKAAGYRGATTVDPGLASRDQPFALKRIRISLDDGLAGFVKKLKSGGTAGATEGGPV